MIFKSEYPYNPNNPFQFFPFIDKIEQAAIRFRLAHDSIKHVRKYTNLPYWEHTEAVASLVESVVDTEKEIGINTVIASLGHDVLEDVAPINPNFGLHWLVTTFPHEVVAMIVQLTDVFTKEKFPHLNRKARKNLEAERLSHAWPEVQTIKLADIIDNTADITKNDEKFARIYLEEKNELIKVLTEGDKRLLAIAEKNVFNGEVLEIVGS